MVSALSSHELAQALDALLPQTQCGQCGYQGCQPYAEAIAAQTADINRCPPGGIEVIEDLARLLGRNPKPLDTRYGITKPPAMAVIDEAWCIGCTLCIQACPVDAIAGAAKVMHTVISADCTGCELCIPPCPVDCIKMVAISPSATRAEGLERAASARARYLARGIRLSNEKSSPLGLVRTGIELEVDKKRSAVARAIERAQQRIGANQFKQ